MDRTPPTVAVRCVTRPNDSIIVSRLRDTGNVEFEIVSHGSDGFDVALIHLDAARARQIFRWLGAYLHEIGEL